MASFRFAHGVWNDTDAKVGDFWRLPYNLGAEIRSGKAASGPQADNGDGVPKLHSRRHATILRGFSALLKGPFVGEHRAAKGGSPRTGWSR